MTSKQVRAQYTQEFKLEAVRQVQQGQSTAAVGKILGIPKASLANWVRQAALAQLDGARNDATQLKVTLQQMGGVRLRAENSRLRKTLGFHTPAEMFSACVASTG